MAASTWFHGIAVAAGEPGDHARGQLPLGDAVDGGVQVGGRDEAGDVDRHGCYPFPDRLAGVDHELLPSTGLSRRSVERVMVPMGCVWAMSQISTWRYAFTSGWSSLVGPTAHLSHQ